MTAPLPARPALVALIGFMGSGKTTVGALLSRLLGWEFVDLDALVEARAGSPIADVFATHGEKHFRALESACLLGLAARERLVVATGGGAPISDDNRWFFADAATAVFHLHVPFQEACARTRGDASRPLLARGAGEVRKLYEERLPRYRELGIEILTHGKTPVEIAAEILGRLTTR